MNHICKIWLGICFFTCLLWGVSCSKGDQETPSKPVDKAERQADIYVAGYEINAANQLTAVYWKNGVKTALSGGTGNSAAYSITVAGNDVYIAGARTNAAGKTVATIWKNETPVELSDGTVDESAYCIFVEGDDVYVGGFSMAGSLRGRVWKNGKLRYNFPAGTLQQIGSIKVAKGDIFVAGLNQGDGYWQITAKDQIKKTLKPGFKANAVYLAGKDIYVCGAEATAMTYFKNTTELNAKGDQLESFGNAIYVNENKGEVYIAGWLYQQGSVHKEAAVWKNGVPSILSSSLQNTIALT